MSNWAVFSLALAVRLILIAYGHWQDQNLVVKYTDIDYVVVTDAARFVSQGQSPFLRSTYRYTPLLAYIYTGNISISSFFAKLLLVVADLLIGAIILSLLQTMRKQLGNDWHVPSNSDIFYVSLWLFNPFVINVSTRGNNESLISLLVLSTIYFLLKDQIVIAAVLYGISVHVRIYPIIYAIPMFFYIGRAEFQRQKLKWLQPDAPTHDPPEEEKDINLKSSSEIKNPFKFKSPGSQNPKPNRPFGTKLKKSNSRNEPLLPRTTLPKMSSTEVKKTTIPEPETNNEPVVPLPETKEPTGISLFLLYINNKSLSFAFISFTLFCSLTSGFYYLYGYEFLHEAYLHHLTRADHRHNFSVYFYHIYLSTSRSFAVVPEMLNATQTSLLSVSNLAKHSESLLLFAPQAILLVFLSLWYYQSLFFGLFILTFVFVMLNKVCTVQYVIWYFCLLPIVLLESKISIMEGVMMVVSWVISQAGWLYFAYGLEFLGHNTFLEIWIMGILYFEVNVLIAVKFISRHVYTDYTLCRGLKTK